MRVLFVCCLQIVYFPPSKKLRKGIVRRSFVRKSSSAASILIYSQCTHKLHKSLWPVCTTQVASDKFYFRSVRITKLCCFAFSCKVVNHITTYHQKRESGERAEVLFRLIFLTKVVFVAHFSFLLFGFLGEFVLLQASELVFVCKVWKFEREKFLSYRLRESTHWEDEKSLLWCYSLISLNSPTTEKVV